MPAEVTEHGPLLDRQLVRPDIRAAKAVLKISERIEEIGEQRRTLPLALLSFVNQHVSTLGDARRDRLREFLDGQLHEAQLVLRQEIETRGFSVDDIKIVPAYEAKP